MIDKKQLDVTNPDFIELKRKLIEFMTQQDKFKDYNFDGSGLNVLMDLLAYNTHVNVVHSNFAFAETFLDSSQTRGATVSRANELGYVPRSKSSSQAKINLSFTVPTNPLEFVIPKGTKFNSGNSSNSYSFTTIEDIIFMRNGGNLYSQEIDIYQGKFNTYEYRVDLNDARQRIIIPSFDVDTKFLVVEVKENPSATEWTTYTYIDELEIGDLEPTTNVYFLKEAYDGYFEVYFGDDVLGRAIQSNNVIRLTYMTTDGLEANGLRNFQLSSNVPQITSVSVTTTQISFGGAEKESIESIKYAAPFYYQSQKRAVTEDDYKAIMIREYPNLDDISVWGGEKNDPPFYGKVFIAVKPKNLTYLSTTQKQQIQNTILNKYNVLTIRPEIVDADYIHVSIDATIRYNGRIYNPNQNLEADVKNAINEFFRIEVNRFGKPLYYSQLVEYIANANPVIIDAIVNLKLRKSIEIYQNVSGRYVFEFNNFIKVGSVTSNTISVDGYNWTIKDVPVGDLPYQTGNIFLTRKTDLGIEINSNNPVGTVNYATGVVLLDNLLINSIPDDPFYKLFTVSVSQGSFPDVNNPTNNFVDNNVYTNGRDQIINLNTEDDVSVTLLPDNSV